MHKNTNKHLKASKKIQNQKKSTIFNKSRKHKPHYKEMKDKNSLVRDKKSSKQINKKSP